MSWRILNLGLNIFLINPRTEKYVSFQPCIFLEFSDIFMHFISHCAEQSLFNRTKEQYSRILTRGRKEQQIVGTSPLAMVQKKRSVLTKSKMN